MGSLNGIRGPDQRGRPRRLRRPLTLALGLVLTVGAACDDPAGPRDGAVAVVVRPEFTQLSRNQGPAVTEALGAVDNVYIRLDPRAPASERVDTTLSWPVDRDTLAVRLTLALSKDEERVDHTVSMREGSRPLIRSRGASTVRTTDGVVDLSDAIDRTAELVVPGAGADSVTIAQAPAALIAGGTDTLDVAVWVGDTDVMADSIYLRWRSPDTLRAVVDSASGAVTASALTGDSVALLARIPYSPLADTVVLPIRAAGVTVEPSPDTLDGPGVTRRFTATTYDARGEILEVDYAWTSADAGVVAVDDSGLATAVAPGSTAVIAEADGTADTTAVVVREAVASPAASTLGAGTQFACAVDAGGTAACWGRNDSGQLGDGTATALKNAPSTVASLAGVRSADAGSAHGCAVTDDGQAHCWGANGSGQLGDGSTTDRAQPVTVQSTEPFTSVSAGGAHSCAVAEDGSIHCWGDNSYGQLGDGSTASSSTPRQVASLLSFESVSAGGNHTCAVAEDGRALCWGRNDSGELGAGSADVQSARPVLVELGDEAIRMVATGGNHACALDWSGDAYCWGSDGSGQLGDGGESGAGSDTPVAVSGGRAFRTIGAGDRHVCAVDADGAAYCWGLNNGGQLGAASSDTCVETICSLQPVQVATGRTFRGIAAGADQSCAIDDGTDALYCWGRNAYGQLGNGEAGMAVAPVALDDGRAYDGGVEAGRGFSPATCGTASSAAYCWGSNGSGQLGDGSGTGSNVPVAVSGGLAATAATIGERHACAVETDGSAWCWGYNFYGQLGDGTSGTDADSDAPVRVAGGQTVFQGGSAGGNHTCAYDDAGAAWCWGLNSSGQLGDGSGAPGTDSSTPVQVLNVSSVVSVSAGGRHSCANTTADGAYCWGANESGQLGDNTTTDSGTPVMVSGGAFDQVSAGDSHTCGLAGGALSCWGDNFYGQLGDGTTTDQPAPTPVQTTETFTHVSAGDSHTCAVATDGTVYCWGNNDSGQLGDGTLVASTMPVQVRDAGFTAAAVSAGEGHTCAVDVDGQAYCWGANGLGQLGVGWRARSTSPVEVAGGLTIAAMPPAADRDPR